MDMLIAAGKSRKNVDAYVLLPPDAKLAVEILIKYRGQVGVPQTNPYIFARMTADTPLSGNQELRNAADSCPGLEHPERICSNALRKYIATVSQILDMNEKEVEMLATHLGHDVRTHKENYRLAHSTLELTAVAQLLLTVERGDVNRWKGKKLCDIEIEDLEVLEDEKEDLDQNHKRGYAEDTHTALWDPPNEATQGLDPGGDSGSDGGDVWATVAQLCGQSTSVITEGASHPPGASTSQMVSTDKKGLPRKSKNRPWSRAASDFLRNTFKPYLTGKDGSVHNSDMKNAQKICGELNTRSLPQIRAKLNNMKLGKSQ